MNRLLTLLLMFSLSSPLVALSAEQKLPRAMRSAAGKMREGSPIGQGQRDLQDLSEGLLEIL